MADFHSFADLGNAIQHGLRDKAGTKFRYTVRPKAAVDAHAALQLAGQRFVEHFRGKIEQNGPGWERLTDTTLLDRIAHGSSSWEPLADTLQLYEAITYRVTSNYTLEVGVEGNHVGRNGEVFSMEQLVIQNEVGYYTAGDSKYPNRWVPARPLFTDDDFEAAQLRIVGEYARYALFGHKFGMYQAHR